MIRGILELARIYAKLQVELYSEYSVTGQKRIDTLIVPKEKAPQKSVIIHEYKQSE
jgi:hypothetical protein